MANIEIGGRLHSTATGNVVTGANEVLDDTKNKKQSVINAEVDETIGDDNTAGTIKGRIKTAEGKLDTLNGDSSTSGSVAKAVADAKTELIGGATSNGNTLKKVEDRTATLETAVGSNGSVDQRIAAAKSEVIGDAASDYNTLGKLEDKIQAEASARESAVSTEAQARQDAITAETNRATTRENQIYDLVHTPEQHYVTVPTYADLANIASPSDDTIYRVSSYNGKTSQVDNTVYSEYGYDGTNFVFLCVKSQIDEVYDISAHHSNNTYVDLAAALDEGNNIPQELRRGGMSIKFIQGTVQSSDNNYVQARCMAQTFTTDVTQWQGVDDEPIADSKNLAKSDGINSLLLNNFFIGAGDLYVKTKILGIQPNHRYRIILSQNDWDMSGVVSTQVNRFSIKSVYNNISTNLAFTAVGQNVPSYYDITTPQQCDYITIGGRAASGVHVRFIIIDGEYLDTTDTVLFDKKTQVYITEKENLIIKSVGDNIYFKGTSEWALRGTLNNTYSNSQLAEAMNVSLVDLSETDTGYIELPSAYSFVIDGATNLPAIKNRNEISLKDLILLSCVKGQIVAFNLGVFGYQYIESRFDDINLQLGDNLDSTKSFTVAAGETTGTWKILDFGLKKGYKITITADQGSPEWINYIVLFNSPNGSSYGSSLGNFNLVGNKVEFIAQSDIPYLGIHLSIAGLKKDANNSVIGGTVDFSFYVNRVVDYTDLNNLKIDTENKITAINNRESFKSKAQFYNNEGAYPIIKTVGTSLYFKSSSGTWAARGSLNLNYASNEALATEMGVSLVDISESDIGYIELLPSHSFVIDGKTKKPAIKQRDSITDSDIVLLANVGGHIKGLNTDIFGYPYIEHLFDELNTRVVEVEDKYSLPSIVAENTDVLIPQIRSHKSSKSVTFGFVTDLHNNALQSQYDKNNYVIKKIHNIVKGINEINNNCLISAMVIGGDYLLNNDTTTYQMAVDAFSDFSSALRKIDHSIPILSCKGNHDSNSMGALADCLNDNDFYKWCNSLFENNEIVIDSNNPSGCYGYFDIKSQKIRIIFINSQDIPWIILNDSLKYRGQWTKGVQQAQLDFIKDALTFDENGWGVIFVSHHGVVEIEGYSKNSDSYITPENGGSQLYGIIKAFKNKTTFSGTITGDFASTVNVDFTNNASNQIICLLNGHIHCDRNAVKDGMLFLSTTTATQSNVSTNTDGSSYTPIANTKNEAAMDFITVDKLSGIIYLDRYGFGVSRKFYYTGDNIGDIPT